MNTVAVLKPKALTTAPATRVTLSTPLGKTSHAKVDSFNFAVALPYFVGNRLLRYSSNSLKIWCFPGTKDFVNLLKSYKISYKNLAKNLTRS